MKVYFDLDGVIRNLAGHMFTRDPEDWDEPIHGMNFYDYLDSNLHMLEESPKTEYCDVIAQYYPTILSCQPLRWREGTMKWIANNLGGKISGVIFTKHPLDKFHYVSKSDWLVEDYPGFKDYSRIILIDHAYNKKVLNPAMRIKDPEILDRFLRRTIGASH